MKRALFIGLVIYVLARPVVSFADIPYVPMTGFFAYGSIEGIASFEKQWTPQLSTVAWGGFAWVYPVTTQASFAENTSIGFELAFEGRKYFYGDDVDGFFAGAYAGAALMRTPYSYRTTEWFWSPGLTVGVKLGYKLAFAHIRTEHPWQRIALEPYVSLSQPFYCLDGDWYGPWSGRLPMATLGVRVVWEVWSRGFRY